MNCYEINPIGKIRNSEQGAYIELDPRYAEGLRGLEGFGYINVLWWCSECGGAADRSALQFSKPYNTSPDTMGVFATRSPARPNPIALTACAVTYIDAARGIIGLAYTDAHDGTPVIDIKPYTPSLDRVEEPPVPEWCAHWPKSVETSGSFDWDSVFEF